MNGWLLAPAAVQGIVMIGDELHFHRRRGLPRWERWGHPLDTASVLACYGLALGAPAEPPFTIVYAALAVISCLLVTKDEFIHAERCTPAEHHLHAILFLLHPIVLAAAFTLWIDGERGALGVLFGLTLAFGLYQLVYWNVPWMRRFDAR
ncbi:MAG TPA: hypothetical protein VKY73_23935 [Polyangiaceae bacterium]|nr:hypothetical protein [Polyangiaceae bacterium]